LSGSHVNEASPHDPRIYFAAERTLLAWLRTGLAILGIGFLVARFGLFLRLLHPEHAPTGVPHISVFLGVAFVVVGSVSIAVSGWLHWRFSQGLQPDMLPRHYSMWWSLALAFIVAAMGLALAAYLAWTSAPEVENDAPKSLAAARPARS
jgi:putative membrane protein